MKFFIILSALLLSVQYVLADCYTGFACSLDELQKKELQQNIENTKLILNYFDKSNRNFDFINKKYITNNYNDLFTYNVILQN